MTTYYVGPGGNNANAGTSWAQRKLTLNGAEDIPVAAGDTVVVGPGVYRELLTVDVSGTDGNPITYIGDVTGENTDGVGGVVRVTGSNDDTTITRPRCVSAADKDFRTFRGFLFDVAGAGTPMVDATTGCTNWIVEDCTLRDFGAAGLNIAGTSANWIVRRCIFGGATYGQVSLAVNHSTTHDNANILIENCLFLGAGFGIYVQRVGGVTVNNCTIIGCRQGVTVATALTAGQTCNVYNSVIVLAPVAGLVATTTAEFVENYNSLSFNAMARTNVSTGANSQAYPALWALPILHAGQILYAPPFGTLSEWSQVKRIAGTGEAADDLFGRTRPATSSKKSWGAVQYSDIARETTTIDGGSGASLKLADAGRVQWRVPVTAVSTTISIKVYRETDYAGTAPQMVIKQPGQADRTTTDAGAAATWNTLTDTFTPAAAPPYVIVEVVSSNTATSGNYDTFVDTLAVS